MNWKAKTIEKKFLIQLSNIKFDEHKVGLLKILKT